MIRKRLHPTPDSSHSLAAKRLIQRPEFVVGTARAHQDGASQVDSQTGGRRRIEFAAAVDHHQRAARTACLSRTVQGKRGGSRAFPSRKPFDQRPAAEAAIGQPTVQRFATRLERLLAGGADCTFPAAELQGQGIDDLASRIGSNGSVHGSLSFLDYCTYVSYPVKPQLDIFWSLD